MRYLLALLLTLTGCMSYDVQTYSTFDASQKTMTVDQGGAGLTGLLKMKLSSEGWKFAVDRGPTVTQGKIGEETRLENFDTFNTRYRMQVWAEYEDIAVTGGKIYRYDISIVDNQGGTEVLTMAGRGIDREIASKLLEEIRSHTK